MWQLINKAGSRRSAAAIRSRPIERVAEYEDPADRVILRHFAADGADVLLTSDEHLLKHKDELARQNLTVMRPSDWLTAFFPPLREDENSADSLERILFRIRTEAQARASTHAWSGRGPAV